MLTLLKRCFTALAVFLLSALALSAQQRPLTNSRVSSYYTYIYAIKPDEVLKFYQSKGKQPDETLLHTLIDSVKTDVPWKNNLPPGNYLKVYVLRNKLEYQLVENRSAYVHLFNSRLEHRFALTDKAGNYISKATVTLNGKTVPFDEKTNTWFFDQKKDTLVLKVDYAGVSNFYSISNRQNYYRKSAGFFKKTWAKIKRVFKKDRSGMNQKPYTGFIAFNKPKYKPGDTVNFKAMAFSAATGKPVEDKRAAIMLYENGDTEGKLLGKIDRYRPGAFTYSFVLTDSLDLSLDEPYTIRLVKDDERIIHPKENKDDDNYSIYNEFDKYTLVSGNFEYEEYELKSIKFNIRLDKDTHRFGEKNAVFVKATDENDLPVADGRVVLNVLRGTVYGRYKNEAFIKDTLWTHRQTLDPLGETKITLPDSIFPQADIGYSIQAQFLNANNESRRETVYGSFEQRSTYLKTDAEKNKLKIELRKGDAIIKETATVSEVAINGDTISTARVNLPGVIDINQHAEVYLIKSAGIDKRVQLRDIKDDLAITGERTADSVFVVIRNPRKLKFFYTLMDGSKRAAGGESGGDLDKRFAYPAGHILTLGVDYVWAGNMLHKENSLVYQKNKLNVAVKQPVSVFPGQRAETVIVVTDAAGKPVADADLTAWAITRKFEDYSMPFVPDLGNYYSRPRSIRPYALLGDDKDGNFKLNWIKQSKRLGLDSIEYFKFTHPVRSYATAETGKDTITQIAPFVVQQGDLLPVHIVYIDRQPVYFSKAQQLQPYSFKVSPGIHSIRLRTAKMDITIDSVWVASGRKSIISFNADAFPYQKKADTLERDEALFINRYMITIDNNFDDQKATIKQLDKSFFLNPYRRGRTRLLVGPLAADSSFVEIGDKTFPPFTAEPNYTYLFEPGWVKQKSLPNAVAFDKRLSSADADSYRDYVLKNEDIDSLWNASMDERANREMLVKNGYVSGITGNLIIERIVQPLFKPEMIKNIILFKPDDIEFIRVYPGNTTNLGQLNPGVYKMFFLLKGDNYEVKNGIVVKPYGSNYYKMDISPVNCADAVSKKMNATIADLVQVETYRTIEANEKAKEKLREAYNSKYLNRATFTSRMSGVVTAADDKLPLPGVSVRVKGTDVGTSTDAEGKFDLDVPSSGKLVIGFVGYHSQEIAIARNTVVKVELTSQANALQEVVVVGYGSVAKKALTASVTSITVNQLPGMAPGLQVMADSATVIRLRGNVTVAGGKTPLYVVDGVVITDMRDLKGSDIQNITILKDAASTALYGARAANGVVIITTKQSNTIAAEKPNPDQPSGDSPQTLRRNFRDYAYWQPKLTTDKEGKVSFSTTYPDDITNWRTFVVAATGNSQTGVNESSIKAFKPLSANFIAPQFAIAGDEMKLIGKVMNYNSSPAQVNRTFTYNGKIAKQDQLNVTNARIDTFAIAAADKDSLTFEYSIRNNNYFDGEQRTVPVYKAGVTETKGQFAALQKDTTLTMAFDRKLGKIAFRAEASVLPVLEQEAEHLRNYKYLCNEQFASKLKGLLAEKRIAKVLKSEFKYDKNIRDIIKKLMENRKAPGTWGWWKDSAEELWISLHAIEALLEAEAAGFTINLDKKKLIDYLVYQMDEYRGADKLQCLQLLNRLQAKVDYPKLINRAAADLTKNKWATNYNRLQLLEVKQQQGLKINIDSLQAKARHTMFGNIYWGEDSYHLFDNSIQETVLAYRIMKKAGKPAELLDKIRGYLLEQRKSGQWRNTYESAQVLETLLPDVLDENGKASIPKLILKGATEKTIEKFPYADTLDVDKITLSKTGKMPVYVTGYQQFWNSKPQKVDKDFVVDTWFETKGKKLTLLKAGEAVELQAKVQVKADGDHVMIEIPIPAGCSYEEKDQQWANNEVHREHFKEKVSIFCSKLKQGTYTFKVKLMPRYNGKYTINPVKAELMYFPVFYGREGMRKVEIN